MNILRGVPKDMRDDIKKLLADGWTLVDGSKALRLSLPNGRFGAWIHKTPSDIRNRANFRSLIRRVCMTEDVPNALALAA